MNELAEEFDEEHPTRKDETIAVNESMHDLSYSIFRSRSEMLVSAIATGQIEAVVGAANLRRRMNSVRGIEGPRSMLSQSGAPVRIVAVSSLRRIRRPKRR